MMAGLLRVALALIIAVYSLYRLRKLSDRSTLIGKQYHYALYNYGYSNIYSADYQMREIVKYVPESMRIPRSNLKLQDAVGQGNY